MYCDSSANQGSSITYGNRTVLLAVGLQCGPNKMWKKETSGCITMSDNIRNQLLHNHKHNSVSSENKSGNRFEFYKGESKR